MKKVYIIVIAAVLVVGAGIFFGTMLYGKMETVANITPAPTATMVPANETSTSASLSPTDAPEITEPATSTPAVTDSPAGTTNIPTATEIPTVTEVTAEPTEQPIAGATGTSEATVTPETTPDTTQEVTTTPALSTPAATATSRPTATQAPTATSKPTATPVPTSTPKPTVTPTPVPAAMSIEDFMYDLAVAMDLPKELASSTVGYSTLYYCNVITGDDVEGMNLAAEITREQAFHFLVLASEWLDNSYDDDKYSAAVSKNRIADIKKFNTKYRDDAYYVFSQGIVEGTSTGAFSTTRKLSPIDNLTSTDAKTYIARLVGDADRAVLTDDAQVCRTTNLPTFARLYPHILDSFPNKYYDQNFAYQYTQGDREWLGGSSAGLYEKWASPVDLEGLSDWVDATTGFMNSWRDTSGSVVSGTINEMIESLTPLWESQIKEFIGLVMNVDYRTLRSDTEWQQSVAELSVGYDKPNWDYNNKRKMDEAVAEYVDNAIANKVIVECTDVDVDMGSLHYCTGTEGPFFVRVHVRYRYVSTSLDLTKAYKENELIFSHFPGAAQGGAGFYTDGYALGEWRESYFTVGLCWDEYGSGLDYFGATEAMSQQPLRAHR